MIRAMSLLLEWPIAHGLVARTRAAHADMNAQGPAVLRAGARKRAPKQRFFSWNSRPLEQCQNIVMNSAAAHWPAPVKTCADATYSGGGRPRGGIVEQANVQVIELSTSDQSQLGSLQEVLRLTPGVSVNRVPGRPEAGEQGALDALAMVASSGGLVAAIKVLPEYLRSRRTSLSITMTVRGTPFNLTATNVEEVMPVLERLLDA
jgi:hypothetical protein